MNTIRTIEATTLIAIGVFCVSAIVNLLIPTGTSSDNLNTVAAANSQHATAAKHLTSSVVLVKEEKSGATHVL
jgi:hypothetical protein